MRIRSCAGIFLSAAAVRLAAYFFIWRRNLTFCASVVMESLVGRALPLTQARSRNGCLPAGIHPRRLGHLMVRFGPKKARALAALRQDVPVHRSRYVGQ